MNYVVSEPGVAGERDAIVALWNRNLPMATAERYRWLYETGPSVSWLATTDAGQTVGATGLMRRTMKLGDRICRVGQAIDLNVDHEHRTIGPALKLQRALTGSLAKQDMPLVYAIPSPQADGVMRRIGYKLLGTVDRWTKPLRSEYKLRNYVKFALPAKAAGFVVDRALKWGSAERLHRTPPGCRVEIVERFDARFDDLWQAASREFSIIGERNAAYLNWRYEECPDALYRAFCLVDKTNRLLGYLVFYVDAQGFAWISDLLFADPAVLDALLAEFVRYQRSQPVKAIHFTYFGTRIVTDCMQRFGFLKRHSDRRLYAYLAQGGADSDQAAILNRENWFLTKADSDTDV